MGFVTLIPILAPIILESLDGWLASGKITQDQYDEAKKLFTEANNRANAAVDEFKNWLSSDD